MSVRFSTFRRVLLGLIVSFSCVCIGLAISILPSLNHRNVFWMIASIESACILRSLWSGLRKPYLKEHQSVASETIGLFLLLPFELVLTLITATSPLERERTSNPAPLVLQIFIFVNTIINLSYTACLFLTALVTSAAFDSDIWMRDIDSSPSPFPVTVLVNFMFPCPFHRPASPAPNQGLIREHHEPQSEMCLPGCRCTSKPHLMNSECTSVDTSTATPGRPVSLSRSLVRIPNAVERRLSIAVAFEV